jgi:hypothetical protein
MNKKFNGGKLNINSNVPSIDPTLKNPSLKDPKADIMKPGNGDGDGDGEVDEEELKRLEEERLAAEERERKIEELKKQIEELKTILLNDKNPELIENRYKNNPDMELDKLSKEELDQLKAYINTYKLYIDKISELDELMAEDENKAGLFQTFIIDPIKKSVGNAFDGIKDGAATVITSSGRFWVDTFARSMEKMEPSLREIQEIKARIYAPTGLTQDVSDATQGLTQGVTQGVTDATQGLTQGVTDVTKGLNQGVNQGVTDATQGLTQGVTDVTKGLNQGLKQGLSMVPATGGSKKYINIKEVQKGGAAAAKRAQNSINQFLNSSVTSSQILNMVKRKTKVKRKRAEKRSRYSRKRAK